VSDTATQGVERRLAGFTGRGYDKGRPVLVQALWFAVMNIAFVKWWFPPNLRPPLLRLFGARIGEEVLIRHRVRVLWPWKLSIGSNAWIGEDTWLLNLEPISIGHDVCLSQGAFLCTGQHDRFSLTFEYDNQPIIVESHAWIGAQALILRGVRIGRGVNVAARACVSRDVPSHHLVRRNGRIEPEGPRYPKS
jgi:putative colanic acid biosynthesis acetyltransferase WcaF